MAAGPALVSKADVEQMLQTLSNWGRWGPSDQLGTLNLITPAKRKQAAALVREGRSVSLSHDMNAAIVSPACLETFGYWAAVPLVAL